MLIYTNSYSCMYTYKYNAHTYDTTLCYVWETYNKNEPNQRKSIQCFNRSHQLFWHTRYSYGNNENVTKNKNPIKLGKRVCVVQFKTRVYLETYIKLWCVYNMCIWLHRYSFMTFLFLDYHMENHFLVHPNKTLNV